MSHCYMDDISGSKRNYCCKSTCCTKGWISLRFICHQIEFMCILFETPHKIDVLEDWRNCIWSQDTFWYFQSTFSILMISSQCNHWERFTPSSCCVIPYQKGNFWYSMTLPFSSFLVKHKKCVLSEKKNRNIAYKNVSLSMGSKLNLSLSSFYIVILYKI